MRRAVLSFNRPLLSLRLDRTSSLCLTVISQSYSHLRTSRLRSSEGASEGARANGPSEVDDRGEKFSDDRGEKLVDDRGVCPVPRAEK